MNVIDVVQSDNHWVLYVVRDLSAAAIGAIAGIVLLSFLNRVLNKWEK